MPADLESLIRGVPDPDGARRFVDALRSRHPRDAERLEKHRALLSDITTLVSFSPLLATTLLQHPEHLWWLDRKRGISGVVGKDDLLEELGRFMLTNTQLSAQVLFARFRRRELMRIYLRDIRRLATIAEITEEISNLADTILEAALNMALREMDERYGQPLETDASARSKRARFCVAALGKLGSRELNYSSDIDLLFIYSGEGMTSGRGSRGAVTNREYFVKVAEHVIKLTGNPAGEGAAYRVDMRLRPHGTLGPLAMSVRDLTAYYRTEARAWERQVMIRSEAAAGDTKLFKEFFAAIEELIFSKEETVETALASVRRSKEKIDLENANRKGYNVKLGRGGIREIEFLAQALQLAHGGHDPWLRSSHTLITLSRLADRGFITDTELTGLSAAYDLLRRTEHVLQMENGLQTHTIPEDKAKREMLARRVTFAIGGDFATDLSDATATVSRTFDRIFGEAAAAQDPSKLFASEPHGRARSRVLASIAKSDVALAAGSAADEILDRVTNVSPHFAARLAAHPELVGGLATLGGTPPPDLRGSLLDAVQAEDDFRSRLAALRRTWSRLLLEIVVAEILGSLDMAASKRCQTALCEAAIAAAFYIVDERLREKDANHDSSGLAVLALGKLGGCSLDYDSDLDLIMVYDASKPTGSAGLTPVEHYARVVELLITVLSGMTRDGNLYRVDLRLRPYGSKGMLAMPSTSFVEYMSETAAIWELLAFVKIRGLGDTDSLAATIERDTRRIIHARAAATPPTELASETRRIRLALEQKRSRKRRTSEIDIKYGAGGMLDVYFVMRFLQLRDNVPDDINDRSTLSMLDTLRDRSSLTTELHADLSAGYSFLSTLDHSLRLTVGRTTRPPFANQEAMATVASRMARTPTDLVEELAFHRMAIRGAFDAIIST